MDFGAVGDHATFIDCHLFSNEDIVDKIEKAICHYIDNITPPFTKALFDYVVKNKYTFCTPGHMSGTAFLKSPVGSLFYDFYGENIDDLPRELIAAGAPLLAENRSLEFVGYTFVGGTLWSNFRQYCAGKKQFRENVALARNSIADFFYIAAGTPPRERRAEPEDYIERFNTQLGFIEQFRHRARTIVLTHFPPHLACIAPPYADSPLNPYFINQIDVAGFGYWIAGHTHQAVDTVQNGCRIIINPLGYPNEYGANGYRDGFLLELPD